MPLIETVRVESTHPASQGPFVIMDKSDYDEKIHKLYVEDADTNKNGTLSVAELKAFLTEKGVEFAKNAKKEELVALYEAKLTEIKAAEGSAQ